MKKIEFLNERTVLVDGETFRRTLPYSIPKPRFKVGDWIVANMEDGEEIHRIKKIYSDSLVYDDNPSSAHYEYEKAVHRLATIEEIESHLIKTAENMGYTGGQNLIRINDRCSSYIGRQSNNHFIYRADIDRLEMNGTGIYEEGKWAEIIPDKKPIPKTKDDLYEFLVAFTNHHNDDYQDFLDQYND
jgi:hypothetical protein